MEYVGFVLGSLLEGWFFQSSSCWEQQMEKSVWSALQWSKADICQNHNGVDYYLKIDFQKSHFNNGNKNIWTVYEVVKH